MKFAFFAVFSLFAVSLSAFELQLNVSKPASLSSSPSFFNQQSLPPGSVQTCSGSAACLNIDLEVEKLRAAGQVAPAGLPIGPVSFSYPFSSNPFHATHQMYFDTCSGFNVASDLMYHQFQFDLGSECFITWQNK